MRDPARIPLILARLQRLWEANPDLRLGQLILADPLAHSGSSKPEGSSNDIVVWRLFNIEDDMLLTGLEDRLKKPSEACGRCGRPEELGCCAKGPPEPAMSRSMQKRLAVQQLLGEAGLGPALTQEMSERAGPAARAFGWTDVRPYKLDGGEARLRFDCSRCDASEVWGPGSDKLPVHACIMEAL